MWLYCILSYLHNTIFVSTDDLLAWQVAHSGYLRIYITRWNTSSHSADPPNHWLGYSRGPTLLTFFTFSRTLLNFLQRRTLFQLSWSFLNNSFVGVCWNVSWFIDKLVLLSPNLICYVTSWIYLLFYFLRLIVVECLFFWEYRSIPQITVSV